MAAPDDDGDTTVDCDSRMPNGAGGKTTRLRSWTAELPSTRTTLSAETQDAARATSTPHRDAHASRAVDNTDWLKTAAIILAVVDHFGHFFMDDDHWWSVFGRLAAPMFFFLLGYAHTRTVPLQWIVLGVILTLLNSWNANWTWVAPNILLSLALVRFARPYVQAFVQRFGWAAFAILVAALVAALPVAGKLFDYGAEGWLWALFGLCQRIHVDRRSATDAGAAAQSPAPAARAVTENLMRLAACLVAAVVYVWQEQGEFGFPPIHLAVFVLGVGVLSVSLCLFVRGPSRIQPPEIIAATLRFIGRHTLEIYAIQLAGSELIVKLAPALAP
jgi:TraX protein